MDPTPHNESPSDAACPPDQAIHDFIAGRASPSALAELEAHLDTCDACRRAVAFLARGRTAGSLPPPPPILPRGASVGRYLVVDLLGSGGMGVVYAAYDPQLDRKVALKVLRRTASDDAEATRGRKWLLGEARAMARLSHPNAITVYEVGELEDVGVIAMELVDGTTLRDWVANDEPDPRAIIGAFLQVAQALAAAHDAGIVHRDVKPENILVARSGDVLLTDFGLALRDDTAEPSVRTVDDGDVSRQASVVAGTPAYMAPEQLGGDPVDERSDQYSLCVTFFEALYGERPSGEPGGAAHRVPAKADVPARVARVLERGLQPSPADRYASMRRLVGDLERALATGRARRDLVVAAGAGAVGVMLAVMISATVGEDDPPCAEGRAALRGAWDDAVRDAVRDGIVGVDRVYAFDVWNRVESVLDRFATRWADTYDDACAATRVRGEQSERALDERMRCLAAARLDLLAVTEELARTDASALENAVSAVHELPDIDACANAATLASRFQRPPPDDAAAVDVIRQQLARAGALERLGKDADALVLARQALEAARESGFAPVRARAARWLSHLEIATGRIEQGREHAHEALAEAQSAGDDRLATRAASLLLSSIRDPVQLGEGLRWARYARASVTRLGGDDQLSGVVDQLEANLLRRAGRYEDAHEAYVRALARLEAAVGPSHPALVSCLNSMGTLLRDEGRLEEAKTHLDRALAMSRDLSGDDHPDVAYVQNTRAPLFLLLGKYDEAERALVDARRILLAAHGESHPAVTATTGNLAHVRMHKGDLDGALALHRAALESTRAARGADHPEVARGLSNVGAVLLEMGQLEEARKYLSQALERKRSALGDEHPSTVGTRITLGEIDCKDGRPDAVAGLERGLRDALAAGEPEVVTTAQFALAACLVRRGRHTAALDVVEPALADDAPIVSPRARGGLQLVHARALAGLGRVEQARSSLALARAQWKDHPSGLARLEEEAPGILGTTPKP